jgi:hypothetical protein
MIPVKVKQGLHQEHHLRPFRMNGDVQSVAQKNQNSCLSEYYFAYFGSFPTRFAEDRVAFHRIFIIYFSYIRTPGGSSFCLN